jgi:uncharacterized delta-60 repeat protein
MKTRYALAVAALAVLTAGSLAAAGPASFRPQSTQKASETPQVSVDVARALAITRDGKPVVAGLSRKGSRWVWALVRCGADGRLDPSFGSGGRVLTDFGGGSATAVATQADGKLLVAGAGATDSKGDTGFALARYTARGRLDPSFGRNGRVLTAFRKYPGEKFAIANAISVAVESEGKIVAAGWSGGTNAASSATLVRYTSRGRLDPSFGEGGKVVLSSHHGGLTAVAVEPDGKIVALGWIGQPMGPPTVVVLRFTTGGELDPSFGQGGQVRVDSLAEVPSSFLLQQDGKFVVAGNLDFAGGARAVLVRYTSDGTLDPSFGSGGEVVASDRPERLSALALEPDGKLVAAGAILPGPSDEGPGNFVLARYTQNGSLDPSFGQGGRVLKTFPLSTAAVQADGRILTAGNSQGDFVLARYTGSGSLDPSFGSSGKVVTALGPAWKTKLASLSATRASDGVLVRWRTASEFDARGFYVYRGQNGTRLRANRALLLAKGAGVAASYSFRHRRAPRSARRYWLREVTVDGNLRWFGPVIVRG